jgi:hypothetical protein
MRLPPDLDVAPQQRRYSVGSFAGIPLGTDAKPAERDEPKRDRGNALAIELVLVEVLGHRGPQFR